MPTIDDVARAAGVGIGTVSRVLNGSPLVSATLRQRVQEAIERLGYQPSPVARAFGGRRTHILNLLVPLFIGPVFVQVLRGIEEALADSGYSLLVQTIQNAEERDRAFERAGVRGRSDGALALWVLPPAPLVERLAADAVPIVLVNVSEPRIPSVGVDHDASAASAVDYCFGIGHRRMALLDQPVDAFDPDSQGLCHNGYREALARLGLPVQAAYEQKAPLTQAAGAAALQRLAELPDRPTAVIAASDVQAIGVVQAARERGWKVPGDLSVVGYSDSQYAEYIGLTTIALPVQDLGHQAARLLLRTVSAAASSPRSIIQPTRLLVRRTCGPPLPAA